MADTFTLSAASRNDRPARPVCSCADHLVESGQFERRAKTPFENRFGLAVSNGESCKALERLGGRTRAQTLDPMIKSTGERRGRRSKPAITIESSRPKTNLGVPDGSYVVAKKVPSSERRLLTD